MAIVKQFGILFFLGNIGIVMFAITSIPLVQKQLATLPPEAAAEVPPLWVLILLQGLQYTVILAIAVLIGIYCTRLVGLHSHLIDYVVFHNPKSSSFVSEIKSSLAIGAATTIVILLLNRLMQPLLPEALQVADNAQANWLTSLTAIFYGGITEEILMRWGLMSLFVWVGWKLLGQGVVLPSKKIYQSAILLVAILFGLLHLPMTATITPLTPLVIIRALLLNGIAAIAYGWLFWQYSLESAMLAHISFHALTFVINLLFARFA